MKKNITLILIGILIGGLIFGSIGTVLALTYKASDIVYSPSDTSWNVSTVGEAINDLALSKTSDNYSTDEQVIGTWIDGKPLYQRTINNLNYTFSNSKWTDITSTLALINNISKIITIHMNSKSGSSANLICYIDGNTIYAGVGNGTFNNVNILTIQYTKATDTVTN